MWGVVFTACVVSPFFISLPAFVTTGYKHAGEAATSARSFSSTHSSPLFGSHHAALSLVFNAALLCSVPLYVTKSALALFDACIFCI
jgi:hypothetical protein